MSAKPCMSAALNLATHSLINSVGVIRISPLDKSLASQPGIPIHI
jgi:hypothetical protein